MHSFFRHWSPLALLLIFVGCAVTAQAATDATTRQMGASCFACHGTNGQSVGGTPVLAGVKREYFIKQMQHFKSGARAATVMQRHAKGYSDAEIEKLADYFAAQKRAP